LGESSVSSTAVGFETGPEDKSMSRRRLKPERRVADSPWKYNDLRGRFLF